MPLPQHPAQQATSSLFARRLNKTSHCCYGPGSLVGHAYGDRLANGWQQIAAPSMMKQSGTGKGRAIAKNRQAQKKSTQSDNEPSGRTGKAEAKAENGIGIRINRRRCLEGQGDLVSRLVTPITHIVTLNIPIINLLIKSP